MAPLDAIIILAFVGYAIFQGLSSRAQASKSLEEYFLAGRSLPGWKAGLSMAATQFGADAPLFVTGVVATSGIFYLWRPFWGYALAFTLLGFVLSASWRRAGVITDAELTETRYGSGAAAALRGIKAVYFGLVINCVVLAMVLVATARIVEPFLLWDQWLPAAVFDPVANLLQSIGVAFVPTTETTEGLFILDTVDWVPRPYSEAGDRVWVLSARNLISILMIVVVTTLYSTTGGLRSVVATDIMQLGLILGGTAIFAGFVLQAVGGLDGMIDRLHSMFSAGPNGKGGGPGGIKPEEIVAFMPSRAKDASLAALALALMQSLVHMYADGTGYLAQRAMACRTDLEAKRAAVIFTFVQVVGRSLMWLPIAIGVLVLLPPADGLSGEMLRADREATYVRGMIDLLPVGVRGLLLAGMLAALASTVDTHLNWGSSYLTNDVFKRFIVPMTGRQEPSQRALVWVARLSNMFILLISLVVMTQLTSIRSAWEMQTMLGAGLGIILVLRWLWWRMTAWGEIAAIAASMVLAPLLLATTTPSEQALRLFTMAIGGTVAGVGVSLWVGPEKRKGLQAFFERVHPPGFWGPIAAAAGEPAHAGARRLRRSVWAMLLCSMTCFCLLIGVGSWMVGSLGPTWFPWRAPWIALVLLLGVAIVPAWWRLGGMSDGAVQRRSARLPANKAPTAH